MNDLRDQIAQLKADVGELIECVKESQSQQSLRKRRSTGTTTNGTGQIQHRSWDAIVSSILERLQNLEDGCETPNLSYASERVSGSEGAETSGERAATGRLPPREDTVATPATSEGDERSDRGTASTTDASPSTPNKFRLSAGDFGEQFTHRVDEFQKDEAFTGVMRVEVDEIRWDAELLKLKPPPTQEQFAVWYDNTGPFCKLRLSRSRKFVRPPLLTTVELPSEDEAESILDGVVKSPPVGVIPYYTGLCPLFEHEQPLDAGEALKSLGRLDGITESYIHLGAAGSGTASHIEDGESQSCNVVYSGVKLFVMIAEQHTEKYEEYIKSFGDCGECAQFVRHRSAFIAPKELRKGGIKFRILCLGPGDAVVTEPRQYHYAYNLTSCLSRSINFTRPGQPILPDTLLVCEEDGLYPLEFPGKKCVPPPPVPRTGDAAAHPSRSSATAKRPATEAEPEEPQTRPEVVANTQKKRRITQPETKECATLRATEKAFLEFDGLAKIPSWVTQSPPSEAVHKTAIFVRSRLAIKQVQALISEYRQSSRRRVLSIGQWEDLQRTGNLHQLLQRLLEVMVFKRYKQLRGGLRRLPPDKAQQLTSECKMDIRTLQNHENSGSQWAALAEGYDGLLCLIALKGSLPSKSELYVKKEAIKSFKRADVVQLHWLLDNGEDRRDPYIKSICGVAKNFEHSLHTGQDTIFKWEGSRVCFQTCDEETLLQWFQPLKITHENIWDPDKFSTAERPDGWPDGKWPVDPSVLSSQEKQCDFCEAATCLCKNTAEPAPQLRYYKGGRLGLRAVAVNDEGVVWRKGEFLGVLAGELVPRGQVDDDRWTVEFRRPDLDGEPVVCAIRTAEVGNCFKFLNQSDTPCASLCPKRRGGKYVLAIQALHDIWNEQEITVSHAQ